MLNSTNMSTASKYFISGTLWLAAALSLHNYTALRDTPSPLAPQRHAIVERVSQQFSDVRFVCNQRPDLCQSAGQLVEQVSDTAKSLLN
jgi:hypothetical protein